MEEYKNYEMTRQFNKKRKKAIDDFWREEAKRIMNNTPTRLWTEEQRKIFSPVVSQNSMGGQFKVITHLVQVSFRILLATIESYIRQHLLNT